MTPDTLYSDEVKIGSINKVPIAAFLATEDTTCPYETSMAMIPEIGENVNINLTYGVDHGYFGTA